MRIMLVDEARNPLAVAPDLHDFVDRAVEAAGPESRLLRYADPYGDLLLNSRQADDFLHDWHRARELLRGDADEATWSAVVELAERCREGVHKYLLLLGD